MSCDNDTGQIELPVMWLDHQLTNRRSIPISSLFLTPAPKAGVIVVAFAVRAAAAAAAAAVGINLVGVPQTKPMQ